MSYLMKLTLAGAAKVAAAQGGGPLVALTQIAVGDGNGNPVPAPTGQEVALVREVYRDSIAALYVNASDSRVFMAEMTIPGEDGGWTVREVAIFDADGDLFAYGNFPETYKPVAAEGSTREMVIRAAMRVASTDVIELSIDDTIVLASRAWVQNTITPAFLFPGGTTLQVLAKASNADGDTQWIDIASGISVVIDVIQETQTLATDQVVVNFSTVGTSGLAVYVEGERLIKDVDYTVTGAAQITLADSYTAGFVLHAYQNDPLEVASYMKPELNLSDLQNKGAARANLGVADEVELFFMGQI